jgi:hypothetical protein
VNRDQLKIIFALAIGVVWIIVTVVSVITKEYAALTAVTPVMLVVAGFLFGYKGSNGSEKKA